MSKRKDTKSNERPKDAAKVLRDMLDSLDNDVLDPDYPIEWVDEDLRAMGADPERIGREGAAFAKALLEKRRLAWQAEALAGVAPLQESAEKARRAKPRERSILLALLEKLTADVRYSGQVAVAFRGRKPAEASDEELAAVEANLVALGIIPPNDEEPKA